MKWNTQHAPTRWLTLAFGLLLTSGALADESGRPVTTRSQAEKLPLGSRVTLACADCKTSLIAEVDRRKGFLSWFAPRTSHECPGCGGSFRFVPIGNPGHGLNMRVYKHTCSICGENSVACSAKAPGHIVKPS